MFRKMIPAVLVVVSCARLANAESLMVPNHSFENPPTAFADYNIQDWQTTGPTNTVPHPFGGPDIVGQTDTGVFLNVPFTDPNDEDNTVTITDMDGSQGGFIFDLLNANEPIAVFQTLGDAYLVGKQYTLTVGLAKSVSEFAPPMPDAASLRVSLYYLDGGGRVEVAGLTVTGGQLSGLEMRDFSFTTDSVQGEQAWANQPIGIAFDPQTGTGGTFDIDNVRLTAVPEATSMLLLSGVAAMLMRRRP
jgi:hypothetical protein